MKAFLYAFEDALLQGNEAKAIELFDAEAAGLSEEYGNLRILGLLRFSYRIRNKLPNYQATIDKAYEILCKREGQEHTAYLLVGLIKAKHA
jgi:hypothetical protein